MYHPETKIKRLQQIEELLLCHPRGLSQAEIARSLGVHRAAIGRYIPDFPNHIYPDEEGGRKKWKIDRQAYLVNVRLTLHEALALHLATRLLATRMDHQNRHAASALHKLSLALEHLAPRISHHMQQSAEEMDDSRQILSPVYIQNLEKLTEAWAEQRKVQVWHWNEARQQTSEYLFSPYFIEPYAIGQTTYVFGLREPPGEMRTFKIERITRVVIIQEGYEIPEEFDPRRLLEDAWGIWYTEEVPVEVELKFSPKVAGRVKETRWHRSQVIEDLPDGGVLWKAKIAEPTEMLPWIRGWGSDVEVVRPEGVRKVLENEVQLLAKVYG